MRRRDREITGDDALRQVMERCKVCRLAMLDGDRPYIVPLNFGYQYEQGVFTLFFHSAAEGRKIEVLRENPRVCFEMDGAHAPVEGSTPCQMGFLYESLIGEGTVTFLTDAQEKTAALRRILLHQCGKEFALPEQAAESVTVFCLTVTTLSGKRHQ